MAMNITIEREDDTYLITMGKEKITTSWAKSPSEAKEWINRVQKMHRCKNKKQPLVVGLCALRKVDHLCYNFGIGALMKPKQAKWYNQYAPYDLLILCVGNECLLWEIETYLKDIFYTKDGFEFNEQPKVLKDFLSNVRTIVVGLGIDPVVKKLQHDTDLLIPKQVEIRDFMQQQLKAKFANLDLGKLSKLLDMEVVKPHRIQWNGIQYEYGDYSDDLVKYGSIEAFLVAKMYSELCDQQSVAKLKGKQVNVPLVVAEKNE